MELNYRINHPRTVFIDNNESNASEEIFPNIDYGTDEDKFDLSYQSLLENCQNLLRLIQKDKNKMRSFKNTLDICYKRSQQGMDIHGTFGFYIPSEVTKEPSLPARLGHNTRSEQSNCLKPAHELQLNFKKPKYSFGNDSPFIVSNVKSKTCSLFH